MNKIYYTLWQDDEYGYIFIDSIYSDPSEADSETPLYVGKLPIQLEEGEKYNHIKWSGDFYVGEAVIIDGVYYDAYDEKIPEIHNDTRWCDKYERWKDGKFVKTIYQGEY